MPPRTGVKIDSMPQGGEPHLVLEQARRWTLWFSRSLAKLKQKSLARVAAPVLRRLGQENQQGKAD